MLCRHKATNQLNVQCHVRENTTVGSRAGLISPSPNFHVRWGLDFEFEGEETELKFCPTCLLSGLPNFVTCHLKALCPGLEEVGADCACPSLVLLVVICIDEIWV